jgi:steroid delta-isomerase-like uncharacterized protein
MSTETNKRIVRRLVSEAQEQGNLAVVDEILADDFIDHTPLPGLPPTRDGVRILFGALKSAFPDLRVQISEQIAEDDKVVTRKTFLGTHGGEFMGIPATGRSIAFEVVDILTFNDQKKIVEHRVILDNLALRQQLGA